MKKQKNISPKEKAKKAQELIAIRKIFNKRLKKEGFLSNFLIINNEDIK